MPHHHDTDGTFMPNNNDNGTMTIQKKLSSMDGIHIA